MTYKDICLQGVVAAVGILAALAGVIWNAVGQQPDADIGAGLLVVLGLPVAGVGVLLAVVGAALAARRRG